MGIVIHPNETCRPICGDAPEVALGLGYETASVTESNNYGLMYAVKTLRSDTYAYDPIEMLPMAVTFEREY
jgi:hypothetical protein